MTTPTIGIESTIEHWADGPRESAGRLVDTYGEPDEVTPTTLVWHARSAPWKRTRLTNEPVEHRFPTRHEDYLEQTVPYRIPTDRVGELAEFDGSVLADRTKGELTARCGGTSMNFLAINLAVELIEGARTVDDARSFYADVAARYQDGEHDPYTERFMFEVPTESTGDPDQPMPEPPARVRLAGVETSDGA
jgi:hypothetical protein